MPVAIYSTLTLLVLAFSATAIDLLPDNSPTKKNDSPTANVSPSNPSANLPDDDNGKGVRYGDPVIQRWQVGAVVNATGGPVQSLFIAIPVPTDWPEQSVRPVDDDISTNVRSTTYRVLDDGVKQMVLIIPRVDVGEEVRALLTFEVATRPIIAPEDTSIYTIPKRVPREVRRHLGTSPFINSRHREIRKKVKELVNDNMTAWEQVETIYDWVRANIDQETIPEMKGAVEAIQDGSGDNEDIVSAFIALCRANNVPARIVWVQGHYYAEFFLDDDEGQGHWFPCQMIGNREFGEMSDVRVVMQKGDNIRVPEKDTPQRFVRELIKGKRSQGKPSVKFVRELLPDE